MIDLTEESVGRQTDEEALKQFLLDSDCLAPLSKWTSKFNIFDVLKISRTEIRHSNMLAWLMDANENHGLRDGVMRGFVKYAAQSTGGHDAFDDLLMDCNDFEIRREWHNIDILAVSESSKYVLCIENKIGSSEHDNQLARYLSVVAKHFPDYRCRFIYLTPDSSDSSDAENWTAMGYADVLEIIEQAVATTELAPGPALLISNYVDSIRRNVLEDEDLVRICSEIYSKHKRALDLLFENRPDELSGISTFCREWAEHKTQSGEIELVNHKCSKTYIRFKTKIMSRILPDTEEPSSGWGTYNHYFYEIEVGKEGTVRIKLSLNSSGLDGKQLEVCDRINRLFPSKGGTKSNWQWRTPWSVKAVSVPLDADDGWYEKVLNSMLANLRKFEDKLEKGLSVVAE